MGSHVHDVTQSKSKRSNLDNGGLVTLAWQLGAKGYISMLADLAPKAELHLLSLLDNIFPVATERGSAGPFGVQETMQFFFTAIVKSVRERFL